MKYYIRLAEDKSINGIAETDVWGDGIEIETDIPYNVLVNNCSAYYYIDGELVFSKERQAEIEAEQEAAYKFAEAELGLNKSDYIMAKAFERVISCSTFEEMQKVIADTWVEYGDRIAQRQVWRKYLEEHK